MHFNTKNRYCKKTSPAYHVNIIPESSNEEFLANTEKSMNQNEKVDQKVNIKKDWQLCSL